MSKHNFKEFPLKQIEDVISGSLSELVKEPCSVNIKRMDFEPSDFRTRDYRIEISLTIHPPFPLIELTKEDDEYLF